MDVFSLCDIKALLWVWQVLVQVAREQGFGVVDMYATGMGHKRSEIEIHRGDECLMTHWPYFVIANQVNALQKAHQKQAIMIMSA